MSYTFKMLYSECLGTVKILWRMLSYFLCQQAIRLHRFRSQALSILSFVGNGSNISSVLQAFAMLGGEPGTCICSFTEFS